MRVCIDAKLSNGLQSAPYAANSRKEGRRGFGSPYRRRDRDADHQQWLARAVRPGVRAVARVMREEAVRARRERTLREFGLYPHQVDAA